MKIGIDCRLWNETGVGRYVRNLVTSLAVLDKKNEYVLFTRTSDEHAIKSVVSGQLSVVKTDVTWHGFDEQVRLPGILKSANLDLVHFPYFSVPVFYNKPFVVTVHDLIVNKYNTGRASTLPVPLYMAKRVGYHAVMANAVYRSKKIIVPSNTVKNDLLKSYPSVDSSKINVTYEGGFESVSKPQELKTKNYQPKVDGRYLLRVGNFYPHKNVEGLLSAFREFLYDNYENHDVKLVLVGKKDFFFKRVEHRIERLNIGANMVFIENPSDSDLFSLYKNACATIIPSFMEGFSLTSIESLSCGTPVIASDIPVHREICGTAALYCNPNDVNDIKQKIGFIFSLTDSSRQELVKEGIKRSKEFSWKKMAQETLSIYSSALE